MSQATSHPVVALWAHPRSMSTATERIMRERSDCCVFHEPFLVYYYKHLAVRSLPMLDDTLAQSESYETVCSKLLDAAQTQPVFFKDMSYYVQPRIFDDTEFCRRLTHVFLIRDPRRSIASYYKLDNNCTSAEIGLRAQWALYEYLRDSLDRMPLVMQAESIAIDARKEMSRLWEYIGLPYVEQAFSWRSEAMPDDWQYVRDWHKKVVESSHIRKDLSDADTVFANVVAKAPHLQDYLTEHQPFYDRLRAIAQEQERN